LSIVVTVFVAIKAKIANNPALAKALTDPNLTPTQKQSKKHNTETKQKTQHRNKAKNTT
jgi:hypothetical protein